MSTINVVSCPLEPRYHFYNTCNISCLFSSVKCKYNCIQLGTNQLSDSKTLSASEILLYKSDTLGNLSTRDINNLKKDSILRIQNLYAFNYFLDFIRTKYFDLRQKLIVSNVNAVENSSRLSNLLNRYPYNINLFKIREEDLILLFTQSIFDDFKFRKKLTDEQSYLDILCLSEEKLEKSRKVLLKYLKLKEINYEFRKEENQSTSHDSHLTAGRQEHKRGMGSK